MRMSLPLAHTGQVRVLVVEDHVALADRIGEGLRDAGFAPACTRHANIRRMLDKPGT